MTTAKCTAKRCNTCGRAADAPYRRSAADGTIVEGCIDDTHTGALPPFSRSWTWHYRRTAVEHRASVARHLARVLAGGAS